MKKECLERIENIKKGFSDCQNIFTALGDNTRQAVIVTLLEGGKGGMRVGDIAKCTYLSRPSVSHHLKCLKDADLIDVKKDGTKNFYYIKAESEIWQKLENLFTDINKNISHLKADE